MVSGDLRLVWFFFFQAEDGIRDYKVTGVQTCALPISTRTAGWRRWGCSTRRWRTCCPPRAEGESRCRRARGLASKCRRTRSRRGSAAKIGRGSGRGRGEISGGGGSFKKKKKDLYSEH